MRRSRWNEQYTRSFRAGTNATYLVAIAGITSACTLTAGTTVPEVALPKENPPVQPAILCRADQTDKNVESADCLQRVQGLVAREGDVLRLNLENAQAKVYASNSKACAEGPDNSASFSWPRSIRQCHHSW
jgi:hypothetical protein